MNVLCMTGNLGRDAELRFTSSGKAILQFSVSLTSGYGEKKKITWVNCSMFGKQAEPLSKMLHKGTSVGLQGDISLNTYTTKDGLEKSSISLIVNDLTILSHKRDASHRETVPDKYAPRDIGTIEDEKPWEAEGEDLPF